MEKLALCSNILYNKDLLDKKNEIEYLKKKIIKKPKIIFKNISLWNKRKNKLLNIIQKEIYRIIVEEEDNYYNTESIKYYDNNICFGQRYDIHYILYKQLNELTYFNNKIWCDNISNEIIFSLDSTLQTFIFINKFHEFSNKELYNIIIKNILWQFNDGKKIENIIYYEEL